MWGNSVKLRRWRPVEESLVHLMHLVFSFGFVPSRRERETVRERKRQREIPLCQITKMVRSRHLTGPKHSLCCCECQSKRRAQQGLPWLTLHRLVRACEMDNSSGGLSGLMTCFPGICVVVLWPSSPSKELCYGAVLPLYRFSFDHYGRTGG